jgi:hypothetical protein
MNSCKSEVKLRVSVWNALFRIGSQLGVDGRNRSDTVRRSGPRQNKASFPSRVHFAVACWICVLDPYKVPTGTTLLTDLSSKFRSLAGESHRHAIAHFRGLRLPVISTRSESVREAVLWLYHIPLNMFHSWTTVESLKGIGQASHVFRITVTEDRLVG